MTVINGTHGLHETQPRSSRLALLEAPARSSSKMRCLRILILLPGNKLFGQERALINLGMTLRDLGAEVTFLLHESWGTQLIGKEVTSLGFNWTALPFGTIWSPGLFLRSPLKLLDNLLSLLRVRKRFRLLNAQGNYSVVIMGNIAFAFYLVNAMRETSVVRIFRHGDAPMATNFMARWITRQVFKSSSHHVVNCKFLERKVREFEPKIVPELIYNCPVHFFKSQQELLDPEENRFSDGRALLFVGQLAKHKGADLALRAFDRLAAQYADLSLIVVGGAPGVGQHCSELDLVARMREKWGQRVRFTPFLSDTSDVYRNAAIHLCPSIWDDPSPNVIFEAKFFGTPTVAFRKGGISELIEHERDGYLCAEPSEDALVEGIRHFLDRPEALRAASAAARESIEQRFSYAAYQEQWRLLIETALAKAA